MSECVYPPVCFAFSVCHGLDVETALARLSYNQAKWVLTWAKRKGFIKKNKNGEWVPTDSLCEAYDNYVKCVNDNLRFAVNQNEALTIIVGCIAKYLSKTLG